MADNAVTEAGDAARVVLPARDLPVIGYCDIAVVGGELAGVAAATRLARGGARVVLLERRWFLGADVTATLRYWWRASDADHPAWVADVLRQASQGDVGDDGESALWPDRLKLALEERVLGAGARLLYGTRVIDVVSGGARSVEGLIVANKSGRQFVGARHVIDATRDALACRAAGAVFEPREAGMSSTSWCAEFIGLPAPLTGDSLPGTRLHQGCRGVDHAIVEFDVDLSDDGSHAARARRRDAVVARAGHLLRERPELRGASLGAVAYEPHGHGTPRLARPDGGTSTRASSGDHPVRLRGDTRATLAAFAGPLDGLWSVTAARLPDPVRTLLLDPLGAAGVGDGLAEAVIRADGSRAPEPAPRPAPRADDRAAVREPLDVAEHATASPTRDLSTRHVAATPIPVAARADVLVVGGGTSGATAALRAARAGARVLVVEGGPGLGGTGTYGGVHSYWFGRRIGYAREVMRLTRQAHREFGLTAGVGRWNIEAKAHALYAAVTGAGAEVWTDVTAFAALEGPGSRVRGAVLATSHGPVAVTGQVVIDATGDADLAVWCGAETEYGAAGSHVTMWCSLAQFPDPSGTRNNFGGLVDVGDAEDATRAVLAARRRGGVLHDHGIMLAARETRHIRGDVVLTLTDQLTRRRWPDTVNVHLSNHDIKGKGESLWTQLGLVPPNLEAAVPYRALLPRGIDGLLVVGKAISATHDALASLRMQADLENLGGVAGLAAAWCAAENVSPRQLDVDRLRRRLVDDGVLPADEPAETAGDEVGELIDQLYRHVPLYGYSDMGLREVFGGRIAFVDLARLPGDEVTATLLGELERQRGARRLVLAALLVCRGSAAGADVIVEHLRTALGGRRLPGRDSRIRHEQLPPDQAAMPDDTYLLYTLALARDPRCLELWGRVAELVEITPENLRDPGTGTFWWVDAVASGAERLGDPRAVGPLERIHAWDAVCGQWRHHGIEPDDFQERRAMLELSIARALARCGSATGYDVLRAYLRDSRALLARQAHSQLRALTGVDCGGDSLAWERWLTEHGVPTPRPLPASADLLAPDGLYQDPAGTVGAG